MFCCFHLNILLGVKSPFIHSFIHSIGMCRMQRFLAVLRSFFHSCLLYTTLSFHPFPPTSPPSSYYILVYLSALWLSPYVELPFLNGNCNEHLLLCLCNLPWLSSWVHNVLLQPKVTDFCKLFRVIIVLMWALCIIGPCNGKMAKLGSPNFVTDKELDNLWQ